MDLKSGKIVDISAEEIKAFKEGLERSFNEQRSMVSLEENEVRELEGKSLEKRKGWMRNKLCICGSGKKFKRCCWSKFS